MRQPDSAAPDGPAGRGGLVDLDGKATVRRARSKRTWTTAALAAWRAGAYRLFAALLLYPGEQRLRWLVATGRELRPYDDLLAAFAFFVPWQRLLGTLETIEEQSAPALQTEYLRLFSTNVGGISCPPYESRYAAAGSQDAAWVLAQVQGIYAGAGLTIAPALGESPDHVAVELEFMAYLCWREAEDWERADPEASLRWMAEQRAFLRLHLGRWFSVFARQVRVKTTDHLYAMAADAADAFVCHDSDLADTLLSRVQHLRAKPAHQVAPMPSDTQGGAYDW